MKNGSPRTSQISQNCARTLDIHWRDRLFGVPRAIFLQKRFSGRFLINCGSLEVRFGHHLGSVWACFRVILEAFGAYFYQPVHQSINPSIHQPINPHSTYQSTNQSINPCLPHRLDQAWRNARERLNKFGIWSSNVSIKK